MAATKKQKEDIMDRLFKVGLLILGLAFLLLYYNNSQNQRYVQAGGPDDIVVLDTRTGKLFAIANEHWIAVDMIGQRRTVKKIGQ